MAIRITHERRDESICTPRVGHGSRPETQGCDAGKGPDGLDHGDESALVEDLAEVG